MNSLTVTRFQGGSLFLPAQEDMHSKEIEIELGLKCRDL